MSNKIFQPNPEMDITIINTNAIKINGKCVIRTGTGEWVKQAAPYTDEEINALQKYTKRLDEGRKQFK